MHAELCYRTEISNRCVRSAGYLEEANVLILGGGWGMLTTVIGTLQTPPLELSLKDSVTSTFALYLLGF